MGKKLKAPYSQTSITLAGTIISEFDIKYIIQDEFDSFLKNWREGTKAAAESVIKGDIPDMEDLLSRDVELVAIAIGAVWSATVLGTITAGIPILSAAIVGTIGTGAAIEANAIANMEKNTKNKFIQIIKNKIEKHCRDIEKKRDSIINNIMYEIMYEWRLPEMGLDKHSKEKQREILKRYVRYLMFDGPQLKLTKEGKLKEVDIRKEAEIRIHKALKDVLEKATARQYNCLKDNRWNLVDNPGKVCGPVRLKNAYELIQNIKLIRFIRKDKVTHGVRLY